MKDVLIPSRNRQGIKNNIKKLNKGISIRNN